MKAALSALILAVALSGVARGEDGPRWNYVPNGAGAILTYAIPDSDDAGPGFACDGDNKPVTAFFFTDHRVAATLADSGDWLDAKGRPAPWPGELTISAGGTATVLPAEVNADEMNAGSSLRAELPPTSDVLHRFAYIGAMTMTAFGETSKTPLAPKNMVRKFVETCEAVGS